MASSDSGLVDRVRRALAACRPLREVRMFGGLSFMVAERMVVCVRGDGDLLVRADPERADELLGLEGARPAEMGAGRQMSRNWISVGPRALATDDDLRFCIGVALEHHGRAAATATDHGSEQQRSR